MTKVIEGLEEFYAQSIEPLIELTESFEIDSTAAYPESGEILRKLKGLTKEAEEKIEAYTKPLFDAHRGAVSEGAAILSPLSDAVDRMLLKMTDWAKTHDAVPVLEGITERVIYSIEVQNPSLVPRRFMIPDKKALADMARSTKGAIEIPGVKIIKETIKVIKSG